VQFDLAVEQNVEEVHRIALEQQHRPWRGSAARARQRSPRGSVSGRRVSEAAAMPLIAVDVARAHACNLPSAAWQVMAPIMQVDELMQIKPMRPLLDESLPAMA
jgi:hypothetical protein